MDVFVPCTEELQLSDCASAAEPSCQDFADEASCIATGCVFYPSTPDNPSICLSS
jgi:hypothetical protein